ncbi:ROK family protein [Puniceicoccaceae bacterium K14]|nr:ROK family protein [Puniceicoccaceae bacterium K14]
MKLAFGIDIGGTNTRVGVVNRDGRILGHSSFNTADFFDGGLYADQLATVIKSLKKEVEESYGADASLEWVGVGSGAPNANYWTGAIEEPPNLNFKGNTPLAAMLRERLGMDRVVLTNDANAAAIGEKIFGGAKEYTDFIMITLGTGLGSGVYVDNKMVYGHTGCAGEVGHMTFDPGGRFCGYGRRGSLENYCSATGIRRTFFAKIAEMGIPTMLDEKPINAVTSKEIVEIAEKGDEVAKATIEETGERLGQALASVALVTSPAAFFLFGGPVQAGDILLDPIRNAFEEHMIPIYKGRTEIIESQLPMGEAAILGAAALVFAEVE